MPSYQFPDAVLPSAAVQVLLWHAALLVEFNSAVAVVVAGTPPGTYCSSLLTDIYKFSPRGGDRTHLFSFKSKWKLVPVPLLLILRRSVEPRFTFRLPGRQGLSQLQSVRYQQSVPVSPF